MISPKALVMAALMLGTAGLALPASSAGQSSTAKTTSTRSSTTTKSTGEAAIHHEMGTVSSVTDTELVLSHGHKEQSPPHSC